MIDIQLSKYASFDINRKLHKDNEIHIFLQFFISDNIERYNELKFCLKSNLLNPYITHIHLLNEKIYSDIELGIENDEHKCKIVQTDIGKRLSYADLFKYIRLNCISGYCVFTNADIMFDYTINKVRYSIISEEKKMFALLRYEYIYGINLNDCKIFGPRCDSQDTWIFHYSKIENMNNTQEVNCSIPIKECHEKVFNFYFGIPGCDNKMAYLINILGGEVINDPMFIRTYHYHISQNRTYSNNDKIKSPYSLIIPAGFNKYNMKHFTNNIDIELLNFTNNDLLYNYISKKINENTKFIIPRISGHENNYAFYGRVIKENNINNKNNQFDINSDILKYFGNTIDIMKRNAGIKLSNIISIIKYSDQYLRAFDNCDIYGGWESWGQYMPHIASSHEFIRKTYSEKQIFWSIAMDIYHYIYNRPFTLALKGKRILIVSAFCDSIKSKIDDRSKIYDGVDLFPECSFIFIKPPVTNGDNPSEEFDIELEHFYSRLDKIKGQYDIALLSCGGYANPIANYIYEIHNASAIYIGGVLQMYFGIYGKRWMADRPDIFKLYMNDYWTTPLINERPMNFTSIENGCYW